MSSRKKKSREELVADGYCPNCSKCVGEKVGGLEGCLLYRCRKCGTLLLEVSYLNNHISHYVDLTDRWHEIWEWYSKRREEVDEQISELEMQLSLEARDVLRPSSRRLFL
jgi:hypothetical protein